MKDYEHHSLASLFPLLPASEIRDLAADIGKRGLQSPIVLYEGKILDGRHRYEACGIAGVKPTFETYRGDDPIGFVLSANLRRRHLNEAQRAMIAAKMETLKHGDSERIKTSKTPMISQDAHVPLGENKGKTTRNAIAETLDVSPRAVATASAILDASPKLAKQVEAGNISLRAAHQQVKDKEAEKEPIVDECGYPIPAKLHPFWERRHEIQELMTAVSRVKTRIEKGRAEDDILFRPVHQASIDQLERTYSFLADAKPYAVCLTCQGRAADSCRVCKGTGLISKFGYETRADKTARAMREKTLAQAQT